MKIAITGAGGLIGSHLTQWLNRKHEVLPLKHSDLDITDAKGKKYITAALPLLLPRAACFSKHPAGTALH